MPTNAPSRPGLAELDASTYAEWFACLSDPTRVRVLHAAATSSGPVTVGELTKVLGISQSTCSHHVRKLADTGFVRLHRSGTATLVTVNPSCCTGLPHAADAVMGLVTRDERIPGSPPVGAVVRPMTDADWTAVRRIYAEGIETGHATFETRVPSRRTLDAKWLPGHRWVAEVDGEVEGWAAASLVSERECYAGVAETSVYVGAAQRGRGVGTALIAKQVAAADELGLWTLQTSIFPENRASIVLHHRAGFRTLGVRDRIAQHRGVWRDTVFLERRRALD